MSKFFRCCLAATCAFSFIAHAESQPFTFNAGGKIVAPASTTPSGITLSPDDFKTKVNEINQQNLTRFKQERDHDIANAPPLTVQSNAPADDTTGIKPSTKSSQPYSTQNKPAPLPAANTAGNPAPVEPSAPAQSNVYTGYQGTPAGAGNAPSKPQGSWGVKY